MCIRDSFHDEPRRYLFARNDKLYIGDRESRLREIFTGSGVEAAQKPQRRFNLIFAEPARAAPLIRAVSYTHLCGFTCCSLRPLASQKALSAPT